MTSKICAVFCLFLKLGSSTLYIEKECPAIEPVPKLDWKGLSGTWYEQARYDNNYEINAHCVVVIVRSESENTMFTVNEISGDKSTTLNVPIKPASNGTGVIFFHSSIYKNVEHTDEIPIAVLALDVNNYLVLYDCKYDEETKKRHDYLWILSRFKTYGGVTKTFVEDLLDKTPFLDASKLIWEHLSTISCNQ